jgi:hypothetical protein
LEAINQLTRPRFDGDRVDRKVAPGEVGEKINP